jgi:hypothetical protein
VTLSQPPNSFTAADERLHKRYGKLYHSPRPAALKP